MNPALIDPSDTYLMVLAWNTSETARAVALDLADRNREQAAPVLTQHEDSKKGSRTK